MKKENADLDIELDNYEPSSGSDNEYDDNEKLMLQQAAKRRSRKDNDDEDDESEVSLYRLSFFLKYSHEIKLLIVLLYV